MKTFIKAADCISAQPSFRNGVPSQMLGGDAPFYSCLKPEYKKYIHPKLLRRMSPIIRNSVCCSLSVLEQAGVEQPDAIIVGTAWGCIKDTTTFLTQLITENEQLPNPTSFIQSTHNTIAGQIALLLKCRAYNFTFSQNFTSFESAFLDAQMLLYDQQAKNVLVGGADEMSEQTYELIKTLPCFLHSKPGEGAAFFILSSEVSNVEVKRVRMVHSETIDVESELASFGLTCSDIDLVIGGDTTLRDPNYASFEQLFAHKPYLYYKPFVGEFGTASAFAVWLGVHIIEEQHVPECWSKNKEKTAEINNVLIYNCVDNEHSLLLLSLNK